MNIGRKQAYLWLSVGILSVICLLFMGAASVSAHSGRTDSRGGHNCNVGSCAGTYHYHNGGPATPNPEPEPEPESTSDPAPQTEEAETTTEQQEPEVQSESQESEEAGSAVGGMLVLLFLGAITGGVVFVLRRNKKDGSK